MHTLTNTFPIPFLLASGSRCDHITLITFPYNTEWFLTSIAWIAVQLQSTKKNNYLKQHPNSNSNLNLDKFIYAYFTKAPHKVKALHKSKRFGILSSLASYNLTIQSRIRQNSNNHKQHTKIFNYFCLKVRRKLW